MVFTTPAIAALRRHFPHARLTYLVEPVSAPVVATNPHLDEVRVAPRTHVLADLALGRRLRAEAYDLALDFHGGPRASLLTWLSGAPVRIGYDVPGRGWMYTTRVERPRGWRPRHAVQNQWDLVARLGVPQPAPEADPVEMRPDPVATATIAARLARAGVRDIHDLVVVHVSAGNPFRRWPRDRFVTLVIALASADDGRRVIVTSGPSEREAGRRIVADARAALPPNVRERVLDVGDFSLAELRAVLNRAALFVGGDSGPLHVAATSTTPIVALYGPTLPIRSAPWRDPKWVAEAVETAGLECRPCDQRTCTPGDFRCLTRISPETVAAAAERALARAAARPR